MNKKTYLTGLAVAAIPVAAGAQAPAEGAEQPNIVLIMADDMGYSDIGCFGGEITTPNLDRLAAQGVRYTQFYNTGRSCPTRASLLTGLYQHQAGIGGMSEDPYDKTRRERSEHDQGTYGYRGFLNRNCVTIAELLKTAGYDTYMVGKWHVGMDGMEKWPLQRGFDRYYGILSGASSYLRPSGGRGLTIDNTPLPPPEAPYYTTDAFTDNAIKFLDAKQGDNPFFLYVAYNAPHWPLQAKEEDIKKFVGKYGSGWEDTRVRRHEKARSLGIIDENWELAEWELRSWNELTAEEKAASAQRMAVYAAQVHCLDYNVGKLIDWLETSGELDNTLIIFLSDNGACAEPYSETGFGTVADINDPSHWVEPSYGLPWAQVGNTPFRKYKVRAYEGGISTPFIIRHPAYCAGYEGQLRRNVCFLPDIMATFADAAGAVYPETFHGGSAIHPTPGRSMLPTLSNPDIELHDYIFGEHFDNRYVRWKNWKAVKDQSSDRWELYDIAADRSERNNRAGTQPEILARLVAEWQQWAETHHVWPKK